MPALPATTFLILAALGAAGCASQHARPAAGAATDTTPPDAAFVWLDADGNGRLSVDDLEHRRAVALLQDLHHADRNADGQVSRAEWDAWWPELDIAPPAATMAVLNQRASRD